MGVYIDMEMPKEGFVEILVRDDGTVQQTGQSYRIDGTDYYTPYIGEMPTIYKAVPAPPHGRLIDADALTVKLQRHREFHSDGSKSGAAISNGIGQCLDIINGKECPTIIPAEEG